ncbi:MAG: sulfatase, partial [Planctomycetes bacterium]|nr:sulfatase [Planctomycetota bacterium]
MGRPVRDESTPSGERSAARRGAALAGMVLPPRWIMVAAAIAVAVVVGTGAFYGRSGTSQRLAAALDVSPGAAAGFNVLLITLDTLRADRVGCYGYAGVKTPVFDALASGGVRFADAVTSVPTTLASHSTILTGLYPPNHGVRDNGTFRLVAEQQTLAECLKAEGYTTAAFIASFVVDKRWGLDQGFEVYDGDFTKKDPGSGMPTAYPDRPAHAVIESAVRWLDGYKASASDRPFFAWVHLFDPHSPYTPPEPFRTEYASNLYDGEVAFADSQVGQLLNRLRELEFLDETLVVLVGDHGEGLGDHSEKTHGMLIYES